MSLTNNILGERYTDIKGYKFDKVIFLGVVFILLLSAIAILGMNSFDKSEKIYVKCNDPIKCWNPYFEDEKVCGKYLPASHELCTQEFLPSKYEYGTRAPFYVEKFNLMAIGLLAIGFLINHIIYNRGKANV